KEMNTIGNSSPRESEYSGQEHSNLTAEKKPSELNTLVTIVIPTLNEQEAIGKVLDELFSIGLKNILVVDGYSSDATLDTAKKYPVLVVSQHGKGKTGALKTAFEKVKTPYMIVMDGDFTYDPSCIDRFLEHMQSYDQILGVRNLDNKNNMSVLHKLGNKIITKTFNALMGTSLSDVCSGMYALRTEIAKDMDLSSTGFGVEAEIAAQSASSGRITEVPVNYRQRIGKQKLSTWKHGSKILYTILKLAMTYRPSVFYSIIVCITSLLGIGILADTVLVWSLAKTLAVPWLLIGIFILLIATHFLGIRLEAQMFRRMESNVIRRLTAQRFK
ncbi:MAG TPA: glycosyltransferase family 2 protein, partial [Nitrososphaeraceae archaeon]|nr:glycosyltransferase family 2 protein [Nitrososphaeraceae archaeon]